MTKNWTGLDKEKTGLEAPPLSRIVSPLHDTIGLGSDNLEYSSKVGQIWNED